MKKMKNFIAIMLSIVIILASSCVVFNSNVYAAENVLIKDLLAVVSTKDTEFNAYELLNEYGEPLNEGEINLPYVRKLQGNEIAIYQYDSNGTKEAMDKEENGKGIWRDGVVDANDSSIFLMLSGGRYREDANIEKMEESWNDAADDIIYSLAKSLGKGKDEVNLVVRVTTPVIEGYNDVADYYEITSESKFTEEVRSKMKKFSEINNKIYRDNGGNQNTTAPVQQIITVTATTTDGYDFLLTLGEDYNFYLVPTKTVAPPKEQIFETELTYRAEVNQKEVEGKLSQDKKTFYPPYYENEDKNAKKDADAVAIINSKTDEIIVAVDGVALQEDGKVNGWYYPDVNNKTVIEKVYNFVEYDKLEKHGVATETVELTGAEGGKDEQTPIIEWTLRRINIDEKEDKDGNIVVTITYNLPIDGESIPTNDGWYAVYDKDGKTIHQIQRIIKKGEDYNKDVTVKQYGNPNKTVTTHVEKTWPKDEQGGKKIEDEQGGKKIEDEQGGKKTEENLPDKHSNTGAFTAYLLFVIAGIAIFAVTRFRKIRK